MGTTSLRVCFLVIVGVIGALAVPAAAAPATDEKAAAVSDDRCLVGQPSSTACTAVLFQVEDGSAQEPMRVDRQLTGSNTFEVEVTNAQFGRTASAKPPVDVGDPDTGGELRAIALEVRANADRIRVPVETTGTLDNLTTDWSGTPPSPPGYDTELVYVDAEPTVQSSDYRITYTLDVDVEEFTSRGAEFSDLRLFAYRDGAWESRRVRPSRSGSEVVVETTLSEAAPVALGLDHPNITVTEMRVRNRSVLQGERATVELTVASLGSVSGQRDVAVRSAGEVLATSRVRLESGERETVTVPVRLNGTGVRTLEADDANATVNVTEPAPNITVTSVSLSHRQVSVGEETRLTTTVTNTGQRDGERQIRFRVFGNVVDVETISLPTGENRTVSFTQTFDSPGRYRLEVGKQVVGVTVVDESGTETPTPDSDPTAGGLVGQFRMGLLLVGAAVLLLFGVVRIGRLVR